MNPGGAESQVIAQGEQRILYRLQQQFARHLKEYLLCLEKLSEAAQVLLREASGAAGFMDSEESPSWDNWTRPKIEALNVFARDVESEVASNWTTALAMETDIEADDQAHQGDDDQVTPAIVL